MPTRLDHSAVWFLSLVLLVTAGRSVIGTLLYTPAKAAPPVPCVGEPITVNYDFQGGYIEDHACKPQCGTEQQRYVLYKNGKATQCQTLPGCNDTGEDQGVSCIPPGASSSVSTSAN
jgi:hypothetical protein